jgi:hypothetical protein
MITRPTGPRYRNLLWPAALILLGIVALLVNTNLIPVDRLYRLADLWPLVLIVIGLELFVRRTPMPAGTKTVAAVLIVALAVIGALAYAAVGPSTPGGTRTVDATQPRESVNQASLQIDVGSATLNVRGDSSLGADLFRAHIEYAGPTPDISLDRSSGRVEISQNNSFRLFARQSFRLDLQINSDVRWDLTVHAGSTTDTFDLASVVVGAIELDIGNTTADITLGLPSGSVPIAINAGNLTGHLHRPPGTGASVTVHGGNVTLSFDGRESHGNGTLRAGSPNQNDTYRVDINGGNCTVTMDTSTASD